MIADEAKAHEVAVDKPVEAEVTSSNSTRSHHDIPESADKFKQGPIPPDDVQDPLGDAPGVHEHVCSRRFPTSTIV